MVVETKEKEPEEMIKEIVPVANESLLKLGQYISVMEAATLSKAIVAAQLFDAKNPEEVLVKIMAGQELGIGPIFAVNNLYVVNKRISMQADIVLALLGVRGFVWEFKYDNEDKPTVCEFIVSSPNPRQKPIKSRFTLADAAKAGLLGKDNWKKYPKRMLRSRAVTAGARDTGIFGGMAYTPEELEEIKVTEVKTVKTASHKDEVVPATVIEGSFTEEPVPTPAPGPETIEKTHLDFEKICPQLFNMYGDMLQECWEHHESWDEVPGEFGQYRKHGDKDTYCKFNDRIKSVLSPIIQAKFGQETDAKLTKEDLAKTLNNRMNTYLKEHYDGRTWSKLDEVEKITCLETMLREGYDANRK